MLTEREKRFSEKNGILDKIYAQLASQYIRERYTLDDELAIIRQKDDSDAKRAEFEVYTAYAEECKIRAHREVYGN